MNVVLIGFMGVGKTSVGKKCAERLKWSLFDTDTLIEEACSMTVPEIFAQHGEAWFREMEKTIVERVTKRQECVIATGGGVVLDRENVDRLRQNGLLIHLTMSPEVIFHRIGRHSERPLLQTENPRLTLESLFRSRERLYRACSDVTIDRTRLSVEETVEKVIETVRSYGIIEDPRGQLAREK
ncbi:MAG: AAA family ATPase [Proteobacteria bacterium]|nr:AAA family ATPase [Pseudomonadota bacterium]